MREKINRLRHLGVLFLTLLVFFLGVFIAGSIEDLRVESLYNELQEQDLEYQNVVTESAYIDFLISQKEQGIRNTSCGTLEKAYFSSIDNLDESRKKLESYLGTVSSSNEDEFARLQGHYANTQINYLMLAQRISNLCREKINTIIYFYADDEICPSCEDQGVYLTYIKQRLQDNVLIFSFDIMKEGPIQLLKKQYNVSVEGVPKIIVNEDELEFSTSDEIFSLLCEQGLKDSVCSKFN